MTFQEQLTALRKVIEENDINEEAAAEINSELAAIEQQIRQDQPNKNRIARRLGNIMEILEDEGVEHDISNVINQVKTGGGAYIQGNVNSQGGHVAGRDLTINQYVAPKAESDEEIENQYRQTLLKRYQDLPLQGIDARESDAANTRQSLDLAQIYIDLNTNQTVTEKKPKKSKRAREIDDLIWMESDEEKTRPQTALEALIEHRRLAMLGAPGSGKTTFFQYMVCMLANRHFERLKGWPADEQTHLPVIVILRNFARWIRQHTEKREASPGLLWDYIIHDLREHNIESASSILEKARNQGQIVMMLDGLDEVPPGSEVERIRSTITQFVQQYPDNRYLVTCRILSYQQEDWQLPKNIFPDIELLPFNEKQITGFIDAWYHEISIKWQEPVERCTALTRDLHRAVQQTELKRLASNPLLLTVMAVVHTHKGQLPDARALLYEEAIEILLWRWDERKNQANQNPSLLDELRAQGRNKGDLIKLLQTLAFEVHEDIAEEKDENAVAGISDHVLIAALRKLHNDRSMDWAERRVGQLKLRAGLLLEREPGVFTFPHRTFQEYLAGAHLARQANFARQALEKTEAHNFWNVAVLLAVGYLIHYQMDVEKPLNLVESLCSKKQPRNQQGWRNIWLAGQVLLEIGLNRVNDEDKGRELLKQTCKHLVALLEKGELTAKERAEAGDVLGQSGDPRFDAELFYLPCRYKNRSEPFAGFVKIKSGPFVMGSKEGDEDARDNEFGNPDKLTIDYDYWIARYPVTVAQYGAFIAARDEKFEYWDEQKRFSNRPIAIVNWHEARSYCDWLNQQLHSHPDFAEWFERGYQIRLPTEAEWEKAARCCDDRRYPWGNEDWDEERATIDRSNIAHPTTVGMYPNGSNSLGLHECSGNVWEWTTSRWGRSYAKLDFPYPYNPKDGREDLSTDSYRVLRGGSWALDHGDARCAVRLGSPPASRGYDLGFRLVLSLAEF